LWYCHRSGKKMPSFFSKLKQVQNKSYAERMRILKIGVILAGIFILGIWYATLRFRGLETKTGEPSKFHELFENLKKLKGMGFGNG